MYHIIFALNILLSITILVYSGYILLHIISWKRLPVQKQPSLKPVTRVSIIIPARNEEKNISHCLSSIILQDYPKELTEIIVCDDHSEDNTRDKAFNILNQNRVQFKYIPVTSLPSNKKKAIEAGIKASSGELIILTDADCVAEKTWVSALVSEYRESGAKMLCGPVVINSEKTICEKFQGLETCGLSLLSGAGINAGMPLLCNGANIAYAREAFEAVGGFMGIDDIPTGDDTLLLFKLQRTFPGSINYIKTARAFVYTKAQPRWKEFFQQRIRWASKGLRSNNHLNSSVSLLVFLSNFLLLVCTISSFIYPLSITILLCNLFLKFMVDFLLLTFATIFFRKANLLLYFIISEVITMFYTSLVGFMAPFSRYQWKGRNY